MLPAMSASRSALLALAMLASLMQGAHADQDDTWNLTAGISTMHDSNLFRSPNRFASSDQITGTSVGLKLNKPVGLQRFVVDAGLTDYRYQTERLSRLCRQELPRRLAVVVHPAIARQPVGRLQRRLEQFCRLPGAVAQSAHHRNVPL